MVQVNADSSAVSIQTMAFKWPKAAKLSLQGINLVSFELSGSVMKICVELSTAGFACILSLHLGGIKWCWEIVYFKDNWWSIFLRRKHYSSRQRSIPSEHLGFVPLTCQSFIGRRRQHLELKYMTWCIRIQYHHRNCRWIECMAK